MKVRLLIVVAVPPPRFETVLVAPEAVRNTLLVAMRPLAWTGPEVVSVLEKLPRSLHNAVVPPVAAPVQKLLLRSTVMTPVVYRLLTFQPVRIVELSVIWLKS